MSTVTDPEESQVLSAVSRTGKTGKGLTDTVSNTVSGAGKGVSDTAGSATKGASDTAKGMLFTSRLCVKRLSRC
jgi:hypothetical protein